MLKSKNGYTMLELVFVIVILGILASVAIPKFSVTREDALITKAKADIASIRSAIVTERQSRLIQGDSSWIPKLSQNRTTLFTGSDANHTLLMYGITAGSGSGSWSGSADGMDYNFTIGSTIVSFEYNSSSGTFTCDTSDLSSAEMCKKLIN